MNRAELESKARTTQTQITYLAPGSFINRRFVAPGVEVNTGEYKAYEVTVRDARPFQEHFTLQSHGFVLAHHTSTVRDFLNKDEVNATYPKEVELAVQQLTGADCVAAMNWMVRTSGDVSKHHRQPETGYNHYGGVQPPAGEAHVDTTPDRADRTARVTYDRFFPGGKPYKRYLYASFWRTFSPGPQDCPLALCDGNTVGDDEGTPNTLFVVDALPSREEMLRPIANESEALAAAIFRHNPNHRWWYFSNMTRDEVLFFKFHDSTQIRPWRVPHTAFWDTSFPDAKPRESIEFRTVAYFY
jgi:hypothetical protein